VIKKKKVTEGESPMEEKADVGRGKKRKDFET
jgi:hypothetical protein